MKFTTSAASHEQTLPYTILVESMEYATGCSSNAIRNYCTIII